MHCATRILVVRPTSCSSWLERSPTGCLRRGRERRPAAMSHRRATLRRVLTDHALRRVELAFSAFGAAEYGVWVAVLVYAYQRGGATLAGVIAVVQLIPAAVVAPLAAHSADRRGAAATLKLGYAIQALTLSATASALLGGARAVRRRDARRDGPGRPARRRCRTRSRPG